MKLWHTISGEELLVLDGFADSVHGVALSPDGHRLACATWRPNFDRTQSHGAVVLYDTNTGDELLTLEGNSTGVNCVSFNPDGKRLASGGDGNLLRIWDLESRLTV